MEILASDLTRDVLRWAVLLLAILASSFVLVRSWPKRRGKGTLAYWGIGIAGAMLSVGPTFAFGSLIAAVITCASLACAAVGTWLVFRREPQGLPAAPTQP